MKIGDKVKVVDPFNGFECKIYGTIVSFYESDRVIVETKTGNSWALRKTDIEIVRKRK